MKFFSKYFMIFQFFFHLTPLQIAIENNNYSIINLLLANKSIDVNALNILNNCFFINYISDQMLKLYFKK